MLQVDKILDFWFLREDEAGYGKRRKAWFVKDPEFDREIFTHFKADYDQAASGELSCWEEAPRSCLALIILLDQFPRNLFRGTPQVYATDAKALSLTQHAVAKGFDRELPLVQRWFIYFPLGHSENLAHQRQVVDLCHQLGEDPDSLFITSAAIRHLEVIERFGRFPHRNHILGRTTTPAEAEFLQQPDSSF